MPLRELLGHPDLRLVREIDELEKHRPEVDAALRRLIGS
jgi:hypothetical protein